MPTRFSGFFFLPHICIKNALYPIFTPRSCLLHLCKECGVALSPHIATFSYKKSFRTHAFSSSLLAAETFLDDADNWLFIGYSLPNADYEFKHLLKTSELKNKPKKITAVIKKGDNSSKERYKQLFGSSIKVSQKGLEGYVNKL